MINWPEGDLGPSYAVVAAALGDEAALRLILHRFAPLVRRMASLAPQAYREDVEEDIRVHLLRAASSFKATPQRTGQGPV